MITPAIRKLVNHICVSTKCHTDLNYDDMNDVAGAFLFYITLLKPSMISVSDKEIISQFLIDYHENKNYDEPTSVSFNLGNSEITMYANFKKEDVISNVIPIVNDEQKVYLTLKYGETILKQ